MLSSCSPAVSFFSLLCAVFPLHRLSSTKYSDTLTLTHMYFGVASTMWNPHGLEFELSTLYVRLFESFGWLDSLVLSFLPLFIHSLERKSFLPKKSAAHAVQFNVHRRNGTKCSHYGGLVLHGINSWAEMSFGFGTGNILYVSLSLIRMEREIR